MHQVYWRFKRKWFYEFPPCLLALLRYRKRLQEVRAAYLERPVRVLFSVNCLAKWKMQTLLDKMKGDKRFEPVVAITIMDAENGLPVECKKDVLASLGRFFKSQNVPVVCAYDCEKNAAVPFQDFHPDIVFYQQPWGIAKCQQPQSVARYALTCYVPYFVVNYGGFDFDCELLFHRVLWRHFILNELWAKAFMDDQRWYGRAGKVIATGHPMLDLFNARKGDASEKRYVIYAPHWSCNTGEHFSTFLENGRLMLEFAKSHSELNWVFKPHPTLRRTLVELCSWSAAAVDEYYSEWERIGIVCLDGNYVDLFRDSKAMITDCASFLIEYACTGNPIIHLISSNARYRPHPISERLFASYYQVNNWDEFRTALEEVVVRSNDYKRDERLANVKEMKLCDTCAAQNIVDYLDGVLSGRMLS